MAPASALPLVSWGGAASWGAAVAVTTRHGGSSPPPFDTLNLALHVGDDPARVAVNRTRAARAFGVEPSALVFARQVHGSAVTLVGESDAGRGVASELDAVPDTDVLVTTSPGVTVAILVADCVPLALVDPEAGVLAGVHAGWRGTAAGVVTAALTAMAERGARPGRVRAYLGPAVPPERYQVSDDVREALAAAVPGGLPPPVARPDGPGHWRVDLVEANRRQLLAAGVEAGAITRSTASTADPSFFSDRGARPCGRQALFARLLG
jgi:YfiH family protein